MEDGDALHLASTYNSLGLALREVGTDVMGAKKAFLEGLSIAPEDLALLVNGGVAHQVYIVGRQTVEVLRSTSTCGVYFSISELFSLLILTLFILTKSTEVTLTRRDLILCVTRIYLAQYRVYLHTVVTRFYLFYTILFCLRYVLAPPLCLVARQTRERQTVE